MILSVKLWATQKMGNLKPGATYAYERQAGVVYATEDGTTDKVAIGWDYNPSKPRDGKATYLESKESLLWREIRTVAKTNPALQNALDQCIMLYHLSKDNGK
jgi:hypothetical protein